MDRPTHFQVMRFSAGTYLALPITVLHTAVVVFNGVGIRRMTLVAASLALKPALTVMLYCTCEVPISLTVGWIRRGRLMSDVVRYLCETYSSVCSAHTGRKGHTSSARTRRRGE
jgi:hypothetical protein